MEKINIIVKFDSSFNCRGVKICLLNEDYCQDKIVKNVTCCKKECSHNNKDKKGNTVRNTHNLS